MNLIYTGFIFGVYLSVAQAYHEPHCGGKQVIVHLFEWKWTDVAAECERFLGPQGYCGVQVSSPGEHTVITKPMRPWWERYQPVSYKIHSRSGDENQFRDMVKRCNAVGVRIYPEAIINHMAGLGRTGTGTGGTPYDTDSYTFPQVPYTKQHFNPYCIVNNYGDPKIVRNCYLSGLMDLDHSQDYVRDTTADYLNHLIDIGVAGFRLDAAKHMWPEDIKAIQSRLNNLKPEHGFPSGARPFFIHEVIDRNDGAVRTSEYTDLGYVTEFRFSQKIGWGSANFGELNSVVDYGWFMTPAKYAFVFVDNHDNQRGHGGKGDTVTHKVPRRYKLAVTFMLAYNYGFTRVMSSYEFGDDTDRGPPHNPDYSAKDVIIKGDGTCGNEWICEHRWPAIASMVRFRTAVAGTDLGNWYNQGDTVAFSRGNKGFFMMSKDGGGGTFQTGLPAGSYCDVISDCKQTIIVDASGNAQVKPLDNENPMVAIYVGGTTAPKEGATVRPPVTSQATTAPAYTQPPSPSTPGMTSVPVTSSQTPSQTPATASTRISGMTSSVPTTSRPVVTSRPGSGGYQRTVVLMQMNTNVGQDMFFRGGAHGDRRIPMKHHDQGTGSHYEKYNAWRVGDANLDWFGAEANQGTFRGAEAAGSPALWTSSTPSTPGYNTLNSYGDHYWMLDVDMDCRATDGGWFHLKGFVAGGQGWEGGVSGGVCTGSGAAGAPPNNSGNHLARCGYLNVFRYNSQKCIIEALP